jgi:hypothetical protein
VRLHVYGSWREMRLRNEDDPFGPWRPFASDLDWRLADGAGLRSVTVEMREGRTLATASDSIRLSPPPPTADASGGCRGRRLRHRRVDGGRAQE